MGEGRKEGKNEMLRNAEILKCDTRTYLVNCISRLSCRILVNLWLKCNLIFGY